MASLTCHMTSLWQHMNYKHAHYVIVISRARGMYGIYCTEARGPCARGLRAINAMHSKCAWYNYFISRGHRYHGDTHKIKKNRLVSYSKQTHKATLRIELSNISQTSDGLVTEGCGQIDTTIKVCPSIIEFRSQETKLELLLILETSLHISMPFKVVTQ